MGNYSVTQSRFRITVSIGGTDFGVWDKDSGGEMQSNAATYTPGGGGLQVALAGNKTVSDLTVSRSYNLNRDHAILPALYQAVGILTAVVKKWPLDNNGNVFGQAIVRQGLLKAVQDPESDSTSNTPAMVTLTIALTGNVSGGGT